jgi:hypothetical protein
MSALAMMCSLSVSAVQGDFRWPFVCWLELDGRSDSQTDREVCETTVNSAIVAQGIHTKRKICQAPMSFGATAGFTQ